MQLNDAQLQEFKNRCIQAVFNGYTIGLADEYMAALAIEVGQDIVPEGVEKSSAKHLLGLAEEALQLRAAGGRKPKAKKSEPKPEPKSEVKVEAKVEPVKVETPPPAPEVKEEPKVEEPKVEETKVVPEVIEPEVEAKPAKEEPKVEETKEVLKDEDPAKDSKKSGAKKSR